MESIQTDTPDPVTQDEDAVDQYLAFMLAGEEYAVDILRVQEIRGYSTVTPIPNMPGYVLGVINLRGTIVPVIDLRKNFCLDDRAFDKTTVIIVVKVEDDTGASRTMGMLVDAVTDVYGVAREDLKPAPQFGNAINTESITGLATLDEKMIILVNIDQLLNREVMQELGETA